MYFGTVGPVLRPAPDHAAPDGASRRNVAVSVRRMIVSAVLAGVLVVLALAQLLLPGIAAQRLRDRLARSGTVLHVEVDAFPAIELLWQHADRVVVRLARYRSSPGALGKLVAQAGDVGSLDASVHELDTGPLTLRDASLTKHGNELTGSARVNEHDIQAAVPFIDAVQPVASTEGQLTLRGTATLLGVSASVDATVAAQDGALIVAPDVPFGGLATVTLFRNPNIAIENLSARGDAAGFAVTATAHLR
jgi:LmeA-like phospholipid-binding